MMAQIIIIIIPNETGKTHQLRIVSKNLGCPIVGDLKYNYQTKYKYEKLKLNAYKLKFSLNLKEYEFKSILPTDFDLFIKKVDFFYKTIGLLCKRVFFYEQKCFFIKLSKKK